MRRLQAWSWLVPLVLLVGGLLFQWYRTRHNDKPDIPAWNDLVNQLREHPERFVSIEVDENTNQIEVTYANEKPPKDKITLQGPGDASEHLTPLSKADKPKLTFKPRKEPGMGWAIIGSILQVLLFIGGGFLVFRLMQGAGGRGLPFGKARIKTLNPDNKQKVTFADVAGIDEAKQEVQELVDFLKDPQKFTKLGGRIPKGVLLTGPPGTGKTLLARAIAGEANVPFFSMAGSEFDEILVGLGAGRVRDLFEQAKSKAPCIIFIDEIDAVGRQRNNPFRSGGTEEQTLNQLLVEMDGFEANEGVIMIGATNRPDVLDPALLRPGRFDRQVVVSLPDIRGREQILHVHTRHVPMAPNVNLAVIARGTPGFSGAQLAALINEAALLAARHGKDNVSMADLEEAKAKVLMGPERKSLAISDEEKRLTAFHEAGHTLVAYFTPQADPVHLVTIIPRGPALGVTQQLPIEDRFTATQDWVEARIAVCMGGRVAEQVVFGHQTTGASNDIEQATELARRMVCEWGMSEPLGPLAYHQRTEMWGMGPQTSYSPETARLIDNEIKRIVTEQQKRVTDLLVSKRSQLEKVALALLEQETLNAETLMTLMGEPPAWKGEIRA